MAVEQVLKKILDYGLAKKYFELMSTGKINKSCCKNSEIEVIDFDQTKEKIVQDYKWHSLKSCDALKIMPENGCIDFIEIKSSVNILRNPKNSSIEKLKEQVEKFDFEGKIRDSLLILTSIVRERDNNFLGTEQKEFYKIKKNYIILTDVDIEQNPLGFITLTLEFLGDMSSSLDVLLKAELRGINSDQFYNLQQPLLMDCKGFEKHYTSLNK